MRHSDGTGKGQTGLCRMVEQRIVERTGRRLRRLHVAVHDGKIRVEGEAASYHVKQLAIQAVLDVGSRMPLDLQIEVASRAPRQAVEQANVG